MPIFCQKRPLSSLAENHFRGPLWASQLEIEYPLNYPYFIVTKNHKSTPQAQMTTRLYNFFTKNQFLLVEWLSFSSKCAYNIEHYFDFFPS